MNKKLLSVVFAALMIAMMAVVASATVAFDFTVEEGTLSNAGADSTGVYKIVGTVKDNVGVFGSIHVTATFDNSIIIPVSAKSGSEANISGGTVNTPFVYPSVSYYDEDNEEDATETALRTTGYPKWSAVAGTTDYEVQYEAYTATKLFDADNLVLFEMYFKFADGKTIDDLAEGDFVPGWMFYSNGEAGGHYANDADTSKNDIAVNNEVVPAPATNLTIAVAAGDVVYFQDGTFAVVEEASDAYVIPNTAGTVVVNTLGAEGVQTAQKVYTVADGAVTEDTAKAGGVLATNEASIRDDSTASGIRFKSTFLTTLKSVVAEYGYITTVESAKNALPAGYVLDMALVAAGKAVKDEAYIKDTETDIFFDVEDDKTVVTAVVTNVPMNKTGVTTNIAIRPYYKLESGLVVYGEVMTRTVYEVAVNIRDNDSATYAKYKDYIDQIIGLCDEQDVVIDFGPLFK